MFDERNSPLSEQQVRSDRRQGQADTDLQRMIDEQQRIAADVTHHDAVTLVPDVTYDVNHVAGDAPAALPEVAPVARLVPKNPVPKYDTSTVVAFLRELIGEVERGEIDISNGIIVHYLASCGPKTTDPVKQHYWRHGMSQLQHLGLLTAGIGAVMKEDI